MSVLTTRELGARGSRAPLGGADPGAPAASAVAAVLAGVPTWWEMRARAAGLSGRWLDVSFAVDADVPATEFSEAPAETALRAPQFCIGGAYLAALPRDVRARHGRHYTPRDLADRLWRMTREALGFPARPTRLPGLVRDRACGAGALLVAPVREHVRASARTDAQMALVSLANLIEGIDNDPYAVWLANVVLAAEALPLLAAVPASRRRPFPAVVRCGDGLATTGRTGRVEIQNPPYGRVRLDREEREKWADVLYGHANLYALFLRASLEDLDPDGVLAAVVPTSFASGLYYSRLRKKFSTAAPLRATEFVTSRDGVFDGVLQETCLSVFTRRRPRLTRVSTTADDAVIARVRSPRGDLPWLLPRRRSDVSTAAAAAKFPLRLRDLGYRCSTGPLVWNRRAGDLGERGGVNAIPVVWAADLDGGRLHQDEARDALRYFTLRDVEAETLVLREEAVLVQRTSAPEQPRRIVAVHMTEADLDAWGGRVVVENHVNVVRATVDRPALSLRTLAAVLSTEAIDHVVRCLAGSVAVSAYELAAIPFPELARLAEWEELSGTQLQLAVAGAYGLAD